METTEGKKVIVRLFLVISHIVSRLSTRSGRPTLFLQLYWGQDRERRIIMLRVRTRKLCWIS